MKVVGVKLTRPVAKCHQIGWLREQHLGIPRAPGTPSVFAELQAAYEAAVEEAG